MYRGKTGHMPWLGPTGLALPGGRAGGAPPLKQITLGAESAHKCTSARLPSLPSTTRVEITLTRFEIRGPELRRHQLRHCSFRRASRQGPRHHVPRSCGSTFLSSAGRNVRRDLEVPVLVSASSERRQRTSSRPRRELFAP